MQHFRMKTVYKNNEMKKKKKMEDLRLSAVALVNDCVYFFKLKRLDLKWRKLLKARSAWHWMSGIGHLP